jgi:hypothetical protein
METQKVSLKPVLTRLFFQQSGVVDWNACKRGQSAEGDDSKGGYFTHSLIGQCERVAAANKSTTWQELFPKVVAATQKLNKQQTPTALTPLTRVKANRGRGRPAHHPRPAGHATLRSARHSGR